MIPQATIKTRSTDPSNGRQSDFQRLQDALRVVVEPSDTLAALPPITFDVNALNMMSDAVKVALRHYLDLVQQFSRQECLPALERLEVSGFIDPDEDFSQLIVTHWLDAAPDAAMQYWSDLDAAIETGVTSASPATADMITDFVVTSVRWNISGAAS